MTIPLVLLLVAEIPTAFFNWTSPKYYTPYCGYVPMELSAANATSYARCFFNMQIAKSRFNAVARCTRSCDFASGKYKVTCGDSGY